MTDLLDRAVRSALQDFFDAAPERSESPTASPLPRQRMSRVRRTPILAAASVVIIGVGGLVAVRLADRETGRGSATTPDSTATEPTLTTVLVTEQTYVVVSGDFLSAIADSHCVPMNEIANYNNWADGANQPLHPGDTILIPPGGCVPSETAPGGGLPTGPDPDNTVDGTPMVPTAFPVLPTSDVEARRTIGTFSQVAWGNPPRVEAALGRIDVDGRIVDGVVVQVGDSFISQTPRQEAVTVFGQDATMYRENGTPVITTVVWGTDPFIAVQGLDPLAFLEEASEDFLTIETSDDGSPSAVTFGELPTGYEVVVDSAPLARGSAGASLWIEDSSGDGSLIDVSVSNPLLSALTAGPVTPIDVDGTPGWITTGPGNAVTWQVDESTYAQISGSDSVYTALELARSIEWVEVGTWITTYDVEFPVFPPDGSQIQAPVGTESTTVSSSG